MSHSAEDHQILPFFWDFLEAYRFFSLDRIPTDIFSALGCYIFMHPTPVVVYDFIPDLLALSELGIGESRPTSDLTSDILDALYLPTLSSSALDMLSVLCPGLKDETFFTHIETHRYLSNYIEFDNHGVLFGVCAQRVCTLLGITPAPTFTDSSADPDINKLGLTWPTFNEFLVRASCSAFVTVSISAESGHDHHALLTTPVVQERVKEAIRKHTQYFHHRPVILLFTSGDHVSFAIDASFLKSHTPYYNPPSSKFIRHALSRLEQMYPPNKGRAGAKVHVSLRMAGATASPYGRAALARALEMGPINDWEQTALVAISLVNQINLCGIDLTLKYLSNPAIWRLTFKDYVKYCKAVHTHGRLTGHILGLLRQPVNHVLDREYQRCLYGVDTMPGRSELLSLDFTEEATMRLVDPVIRGYPYVDPTDNSIKYDQRKYAHVLDRLTRQTIEGVLLDQVTIVPFDKWYSSRMFWGASGGAPGATITWSDNAGHREKLRLNKRGALLALSGANVKKKMYTPTNAVTWSTKSLKFESGKLRSILNTTVEHYVIQSYLLANFDRNVRTDTWYSSSHHAAARVSATLRRLYDLKHNFAEMWDYADYNINHTFLMMSGIFKHTAEVLAARASQNTDQSVLSEALSDIQKSASYAITARQNTYLKDNDTNMVFRIMRSLQSGERATSFINSISNEIDTQMARHVYKTLFKHEPLIRTSDKQGDDVFETTVSPKAAILLASVYNLVGAAGQIYKITADYHDKTGAKGEFLRYSYDAAANVVSGYPIRAMMGWVHGEYFNESLPNPSQRTATIATQAQKLARRGFKLSSKQIEDVIFNNAAATLTLPSGKKERILPPPGYVSTPRMFGGLGIEKEAKDSQIVTLGLDANKGDFSPLSYLGLQSTSVRCAFLIPSGEGKSTLARAYPNLFVDHDTLVEPHSFWYLREEATLTANWSNVNRYLRTIAEGVEPQKILLTWSTHTTPRDRKVHGAYMLNRPTSLRANKSNRQTIQSELSPTKIRTLPSFKAVANAAIKDAVSLISAISSTPRVVTVRGFVKNGSEPSPRFLGLSPSNVIRKTKTDIIDYKSMYSLGVKRTEKHDEAVLLSGVSGAIPANALSSAIDVYVSELRDYYARKQRTVYTVEIPDIQMPSMSAVASLIYKHLALAGDPSQPWRILKGFVVNQEGYPAATRVIHNYNSLERLMQVSGFSVGDVFRSVISSVSKHGDLYPAENQMINFLDLISSTSFHRTKKRTKTSEHKVVDRFREFILRYAVKRQHLSEQTSDSIVTYLRGELDLLPPYNIMSYPADLTSFLRDITLASLEAEPDCFKTWVHTSPEARCVLFARHEYKVHIAFHQNVLETDMIRLSD